MKKYEIQETNNFTIEDLGIQEEWVYDIEVEDNHNFFANSICVHNSVYLSLEKVIIKKFGKDYEETVDFDRLQEFTLNYINKIAMPIVRERLDNVYAYAMNAYLPEKLQEDPEVICDSFISVAPKMYLARYKWNEGVFMSKQKLKVTGLSMVRSTTPKFYREELKKAMDILIDGDIPKVMDYMIKTKEATFLQEPENIAINQGVSSLDYTWDGTIKKFRKFNGEKYLSAPVNSRACLTHNLYIKDSTDIKTIEGGDKISFLYMKVPNPLFASSNALGFKNSKIFDGPLKDYIDYDLMYQKGFEKSIKLITDPIGWDLTPKDEQMDLDEW